MVAVNIIALAGEAREMRHARAVIVGRGNFQLIDIDLRDPAFSVKQRGGIYFVEGIYANFLVILTGAKTAQEVKTKADGRRVRLDGPAVFKSIGKGFQNVAVAVIKGHCRASSHIRQHSLVLVAQRVVLRLVNFVLTAGLQRAAVAVGGVLGKPFLHFFHCLADKQLLIGVHLAGPGAGPHLVAFTALALGHPGGDFRQIAVIGHFDHAIHFFIVVAVRVIALAGKAREMRHARAVIVGCSDLQLVELREENFPFSIKNNL